MIRYRDFSFREMIHDLITHLLGYWNLNESSTTNIILYRWLNWIEAISISWRKIFKNAPRLGMRTSSSMWTRPLVPRTKSLLRIRAVSIETPFSSQCIRRRLPLNVLMWCSSMMADTHNGCTSTWFCSKAVHYANTISINLPATSIITTITTINLLISCPTN